MNDLKFYLKIIIAFMIFVFCLFLLNLLLSRFM